MTAPVNSGSAATGGLRPTRQRLAVLAALEDNDEFRSAQQIHARLREQGDTVGLATVYRTLQLLADHDEVDVLRLDDGEALYRRCSHHHHHHLVCQSCAVTIEVAGEVVEEWTTSIARRHGFSEISHSLEIFGLCRECQQSGQSSG